MILHQILLDLFRVVIAREFEAAADAVDVRIHDHAFVLLEPCAEHDVGGLAGYAGQSEKLIHLIGHLAAEITHDLFCGSHHRLRFVAKKAGRADVGLELFGLEGREILTVGYFLNSSGVTMFTRTSVDWAERMVATSKFPRAVVVQGAGHVGIESVEPLKNFLDPVGCGGIVGSCRDSSGQQRTCGDGRSRPSGASEGRLASSREQPCGRLRGVQFVPVGAG